MTVQTAARTEYVLFDGMPSYDAAATEFSSEFSISEGMSIFLMGEKAGTWYLDGLVQGQWLPLVHGSYAALIPVGIVPSKEFILPSKVRLAIKNTADDGKLFAALRVSPSRVEQWDTATPAALSWATAGDDMRWVEIGPTIAVSVNASEIELGHVGLIGSDDTEAEVCLPTAATESKNALVVQAPVLGVTTGAALDADGTGTIQQYLRGLLKAFIARIPTDPAKESGKLTDLSTNLGALADAKVDTDAVGSLSSKLRGIVSRLLSIDTNIGNLAITQWPYPGASVYLTIGAVSAELGSDLVAGTYIVMADTDCTFAVTNSGGGGAAVSKTTPGIMWPAMVPYNLKLAAAKRIAAITGGLAGTLMVLPVTLS